MPNNRWATVVSEQKFRSSSPAWYSEMHEVFPQSFGRSFTPKAKQDDQSRIILGGTGENDTLTPFEPKWKS